MGLAQKKQTLKSRPLEAAAAEDQTQTSTSMNEAHNGAELVESYEAGNRLRHERDAIQAAGSSTIPQTGKGEVTSPEIAKVAAWYLGVDMAELDRRINTDRKGVLKDIRSMAAALLTQAPDHG